MPLYLVTNKVTHARMVVVAPNAQEACRVHPTNLMARREGRGWVQDKGGHFYRTVGAPPPSCWPYRLSLIHADLLAEQPVREFDGITDVLAFEAQEALREEGEGPEGWGGYTRKDLLP